MIYKKRNDGGGVCFTDAKISCINMELNLYTASE